MGKHRLAPRLSVCLCLSQLWSHYVALAGMELYEHQLNLKLIDSCLYTPGSEITDMDHHAARATVLLLGKGI